MSRSLFRLLNKVTSEDVITIHNQECSAENELYQQKSGEFLKLFNNFGIDSSGFEPTGQSAFQSWLPYFDQQQSVISVHNSFISETDLEFSKKRVTDIKDPIFYCLCIQANLYIEATIPPIEMLRKSGAVIVLGTDSYASNHQLDILEEIKTIQHQTGYQVPLGEILQWATINGAKALKMDESIGSFEKGKKPGIVLLENLNAFDTTPQSIARRLL